jgi:hypothetical protein
MKTSTNVTKSTSKAKVPAARKVENKDNLDSREGEEQLDKGSSTTHNKKEKHSTHKNSK